MPVVWEGPIDEDLVEQIDVLCAQMGPGRELTLRTAVDRAVSQRWVRKGAAAAQRRSVLRALGARYVQAGVCRWRGCEQVADTPSQLCVGHRAVEQTRDRMGGAKC